MHVLMSLLKCDVCTRANASVSGVLYVHVHGAIDLPKEDSTSQSDPYVSVLYNGNEVGTVNICNKTGILSPLFINCKYDQI